MYYAYYNAMPLDELNDIQSAIIDAHPEITEESHPLLAAQLELIWAAMDEVLEELSRNRQRFEQHHGAWSYYLPR